MADTRPICKYDPACYQKNEGHLKAYKHPSREVAKPPPPAAPPAAPPAPEVKQAGTTHRAGPGGAATKQPTIMAAFAAGAATMPKRTLFVPGSKNKAPADATVAPADATVAPVVGTASSATKPPAVSILSEPSPRKTSSAERRPATPPRQAPPAQPSPPKGHTGTASPSAPRVPSSGSSPMKSGPAIAVPTARNSVLGSTATATMSTKETLAAVFEMPYPSEEMDALLEAARTLKPDDALQPVPHVKLAGPFRVLAGTKRSFTSDVDKWTRDRRLCDAPEVECVAVVGVGGASSTVRYFLHRDDPSKLPTMVVSCAGDATKYTIEGSSLAVVLANAIDGGKSAATAKVLATFAKAPNTRDAKAVSRSRRSASVANTANGLGIVVPYDKRSEVGYREPLIERGKLLRMLEAANDGRLNAKQREELDEQLRFNDISNDECDFGLGLELGQDFMTKVGTGFGGPEPRRPGPVARHANSMLSLAYSLLGRGLFAHIVTCSLSRIEKPLALEP